MIDLYYAQTGNSLRAAIALEECELEHRRHKVNLLDGEQRSETFLARNPFGAVPVMVDDGSAGGEAFTLTQSGAIMLHAAERVGRFIPDDATARRETMRWFMAAITDVAPANTYLLYMSVFAPDKTEDNTRYLRARLLALLKQFDVQLTENKFLVADISIADLSLFPMINMRRADIEEAGGFDGLLRWADVMLERPGVQRAMDFR